MDDTTDRKQAEISGVSRMRRECLSFTVSLQQGFGYVKAFFVGQAKKLTARNEKEAAEADLLTAKMQAEATDAAEDTKNRLNKSV
ncbi:uncharacterized protein LOC126795815 [Argentina anserina]|uniref:uncharacterized protein LOC126795815 n=1 Tax=Argentina anserina TaxID=57926 RepID=UPI002176880E|nr:uncharacterized protein LOC126795815 [Potentilla anserina]